MIPPFYIKSLVTVYLLLLPEAALSELDVEISDNSNQLSFLVCNTQNAKAESYYGVRVEKLQNKMWKLSRWDTDCPCKAKCKKKITRVEPGQCKSHTWDKTNLSCKNEKAGKYRLVVYGNWNTELERNEIHGISKEFLTK